MDPILFRLPNELIATIFDHIDENGDLRALAQSCSRLQPLAESVYYRHIFHRSGEEVTGLSDAIASRPERALYIQSIDSRCRRNKYAGLDNLAPVIHHATNLRELIIESPFCGNNKYTDELMQWRQMRAELIHPVCMEDGLTNLRHLTLHLSDTPRYWIVDENIAPILAHPTLFTLTISCADLQEGPLSLLKDKPKTPLRQLNLIECDMSLEALEIMLALPHALEHLYLGENCYHQWFNTVQFHSKERNVNQLCSTDPTRFFNALGHQKLSLQSLTYAVRALSTSSIKVPSPCKGLSEFLGLQHVTLDGYCAYFERVMALPQTAPPNLVSLTAKGDMFRIQNANGLSLQDDYRSQIGWTIAHADFATQLEHVQISSSRTFTNISQNHRNAVKELGSAFRDKKVHMRLWKRTFHRNIPPFLWGEQEYREELVYDSADGFTKAFGSSGDREADDIDF